MRSYDRTGFYLLESMLAIAVIMFAVFVGFRIVVVRHQRSNNAPPSQGVDLIAATIFEEIQATARGSGFSAVDSLNDTTRFYDASGRPVDGSGRYRATIKAQRDSKGQDYLRIVYVRVEDLAGGKGITLVDAISAAPPEQYAVIAGSLPRQSDGVQMSDAHWGQYFGALFARRQKRAYDEKDCNPNTFPLPSNGTSVVEPLAAPNPAPWRRQ